MSHNFSEAYWEKQYQEPNGKPKQHTVNSYLVDELGGLTPGLALDAGCGTGVDATWLAQHGWGVTAIDISRTVLQEAEAAARVKGVVVGFEQVDLTAWVPPTNHFDLVTSHYVHTTNNRQYIEKLGRAVKPGGILLIVGHQPPKGHTADAFAHGSHTTAREIISFLKDDEWEIEIAEPRMTTKLTSDGHTVLLHDSVFKARKRLI